MPSVWARHPRFSLLVLVALCITTLVLLGQSNFQEGSSGYTHYATTLKDDSLASRLERADDIYIKVLKDRKGLIQKFGPSANDVIP